MEIISYLKGKKAQSAVKEIHQTIGQDEYKNGDKEIVGNFNNADDRISSLEQNNVDRKLSSKVSDMTKKVTVRLNEQSLQSESLVKMKKYGHSNLVFESFSDNLSIDSSKSKNIEHNSSLGHIKKGKTIEKGILELLPYSSKEPISIITVSLMVSDNTSKAKSIDIEFIDDTKTDLDLYPEEQEFISETITLESEAVFDYSTFNDLLKLNKNVFLFVSNSEDGILFSEFVVLEKDIRLSKFIKLKVKFVNELEEEFMFQNDIIQNDGYFDGSKIIGLFDDITGIRRIDPFIYQETSKEDNLSIVEEYLQPTLVSSNIFKASNFIQKDEGLRFIDDASSKLRLQFIEERSGI